MFNSTPSARKIHDICMVLEHVRLKNNSNTWSQFVDPTSHSSKTDFYGVCRLQQKIEIVIARMYGNFRRVSIRHSVNNGSAVFVSLNGSNFAQLKLSKWCQVKTSETHFGKISSLIFVQNQTENVYRDIQHRVQTLAYTANDVHHTIIFRRYHFIHKPLVNFNIVTWMHRCVSFENSLTKCQLHTSRLLIIINWNVSKLLSTVGLRFRHSKRSNEKISERSSDWTIRPANQEVHDWYYHIGKNSKVFIC